ncbi:MAG: DsbA family protein [Sphingomicrobium sp.]
MIKNVYKLATFAALSVALTGAGASAAQPTGQDQQADSLEQQRQVILEDPVAPRIQPKAYDVSIIEYMDYQCPYCRASHAPMKQLLATDKKVRVIFRDWPIFGTASERAARLAIASQWQDKHTAFHDALMTTPAPLSEEKIQAAATQAGVDWPRLEADLKTHSLEIEALLKRNGEQAEQLGLEGTPGFIIGNVQSFGGMSLVQFRAAVSQARHDGALPRFSLPLQSPGL